MHANYCFYARLKCQSKLKYCFQTKKCGSGIVADEDIKQGEFVIEYVGEGDTLLLIVFIIVAAYFAYCTQVETFDACSLFNAVIDDKTCEDRLWKMKHLGETNFYLCEINRDMVIDATYKGNKSRYINHSCDPNTEMQKWLLIDPYF